MHPGLASSACGVVGRLVEASRSTVPAEGGPALAPIEPATRARTPRPDLKSIASPRPGRADHAATRAQQLRVRRLLWTAIGVAAAITTTLVVIPTLDIAISSLAYGPAGFVLPRFGLVLAMSWLVTIVSWIAVLGAVVLLVANVRAGYPVLWALDTSRLLLVLLTFLLVPGLLVNTILKHHVGRARPTRIVQFGGDAQFSRAGVPADQCRRNCTFPSGEASAAFALAAVGVATGSPAVLAGALAIGTLVSIVRVLTGAHFVSDVASSALLTLLAIVLLGRLLVRRPRAAPG